MKTFSIIFALVLVSATLLFALGNTQVVDVSFVIWKVDGSLALVIFIAFLTGIITAALILVPTIIKKSLRIAKLGKEVRVHESKGKDLNSIKPESKNDNNRPDIN
jgi:uncharacterized integral membrane protein